MGTVYSAVKNSLPNYVVNVPSRNDNIANRKRKTDVEDDFTNTPKKRRMESTMKFIYQVLFLEGKDSDVTVIVNGDQWHLHKVYLQQSLYFKSMFSGRWSETGESDINIDLTDPNIDKKCVNLVFSSCYSEEIEVEPSMVVGVLAASSLFQMEGLIEQCRQVMLENLAPETAVEYWRAGRDYGLNAVKEAAVGYLCFNLTTFYHEHHLLLAAIEPSLMAEVVSSTHLWVLQTEMFLYLVLRAWLYLRLSDDHSIPGDLNTASSQFFSRLYSKEERFLLEREEYSQYRRIFSRVRTLHLLQHLDDATIVMADKLIPDDLLAQAYRTHWLNLLNIIKASDNHQGAAALTEEEFNERCLRLGRSVDSTDQVTWRWEYFNFGLELLWSLRNTSISVQRVPSPLDPWRHHTQPSPTILVRCMTVNINSKRQVVRREDSGMQVLSLGRHQEVKVLTVPRSLHRPLYIQVHLLLHPPSTSPSPSL